MHAMKRGIGLLVLSFWLQVAIADLYVGGVTGRPESGVAGTLDAKPRTSADFLFRQNATPEEDYQAGIVAYRRNELIEAQGVFERAAKQGHTGAMVRLGEMLDRSGFIAEAVTWYFKAAKLGNADAQYSLGTKYMDLNAYDLTKTGVKADPSEALKWFILAAEQGHEAALSLVCLAYVGGGMGLKDEERTDAEVLKWIDLAIEKVNDPDAMDALAKAYRTGKYGFEIDIKLADEWSSKAREARGIKEEVVKKRKKQRI